MRKTSLSCLHSASTAPRPRLSNNRTAQSMTSHAHLCLVLHNHQPIGNFEGVFEQAYQDSYLPFLEVFEPYDEIRISLHTSGPLMLWLAQQHPEYLQRVRALVEAGRVEIIGGPFYEPIMAMLPSRDRVGQIHAYGDWLEQHLGTRPAGMWVPERVWEPNMVSDIARAGIEYTLLDDFHFRAAGWTDEQLTGYFMTEDEGYTLRVFPGSERLRYTVPFARPRKPLLIVVPSPIARRALRWFSEMMARSLERGQIRRTTSIATVGYGGSSMP